MTSGMPATFEPSEPRCAGIRLSSRLLTRGATDRLSFICVHPCASVAQNLVVAGAEGLCPPTSPSVFFLRPGCPPPPGDITPQRHPCPSPFFYTPPRPPPPPPPPHPPP